MKADDWLSVAGLAVTVVGFALTIWQLARTANAASATERAVRASAQTHLLLLLPQFRQLETELDYAVAEGQRTLLLRILTSYSYLASEVAGLVEVHYSMHESLAADLRQSVAIAASTKDKVYRLPKQKLVGLTTDFRTALAGITVQISSIGASQQARLAGLEEA